MVAPKNSGVKTGQGPYRNPFHQRSARPILSKIRLEAFSARKICRGRFKPIRRRALSVRNRAFPACRLTRASCSMAAHYD